MPTHRATLAELSTSEIAYLARMKHETARRRLAEAGLEPVRTDGRSVYFDPRDALPVLLGVGKLDLSAERARLDRARAELAELDLAAKRGEYVRGEDVDAFTMGLVSTFAKALQAMPSKAAPEVRVTASDAEAEAILAAYRDEALSGLADAARAAGERVERRKRGERGSGSA